MEIWLWVIVSILWAISLSLAGFGIRFIFKGIRDLRQATLSQFADKIEDFLEKNKERAAGYDDMLKRYEKMITDVRGSLGKNEPTPQSTSSVKFLEKLQKGYENVAEGYVKNLEAQKDIFTKLLGLTNRGGIRGFTTLSQISATKNIAIAAVLIAFSSIGFSISSAILSVVT